MSYKIYPRILVSASIPKCDNTMNQIMVLQREMEKGGNPLNGFRTALNGLGTTYSSDDMTQAKKLGLQPGVVRLSSSALYSRGLTVVYNSLLPYGCIKIPLLNGFSMRVVDLAWKSDFAMVTTRKC